MEPQDFLVEELLDLPNGDDYMCDAFMDTSSYAAHSADSSTVTAVDSCNSSLSGDNHFLPTRSFPDPADLCVPYDDMAELEWLSNFVEESFSSEDIGVLNGSQARPGPDHHGQSSSVPVLGKVRSKLSRVAPSDWSTRLLMVSKRSSPSSGGAPARKRGETLPVNGEARRCLHCQAEKTPQWRTGPLGPKTLCNACGVRYKSGRLVPEYRPAASPTFVSAKHSNSHRKVLELRRQKDVVHHHHHPQFAGHAPPGVFVGGGVGSVADDYLIHHHIPLGSDYRQLI